MVLVVCYCLNVSILKHCFRVQEALTDSLRATIVLTSQ